MKILKRIIIILLSVIGTFILLVAGLLAFLTAREFKPAALEPVAVERMGDSLKSIGDTVNGNQLYPGQSFSVLSWNIGYGALGDNADFFMDGGKMVKSSSKARVEKNLDEITRISGGLNPHVFFFQEVDEKSVRSYKINQRAALAKAFPDYNNSFTLNYKVDFIPYPLPPIGKVQAGIMTLSTFGIKNSERISLPCPFSWPVRLGNLRRCLLVSRIPIGASRGGSNGSNPADVAATVGGDSASSGKELVLVNFHLEAYDSGEGKAAQTKVLREFLQAEYDKGNYVIAGGDCNQVFSTFKDAFPVLEEGHWAPGIIETSDFPDGWGFYMDSSNPTCRSLDRPLAGADRSDFQFYLIDGFIASQNVQVESVRTLDYGFVSSDHNPVLLEVTLK